MPQGLSLFISPSKWESTEVFFSEHMMWTWHVEKVKWLQPQKLGLTSGYDPGHIRNCNYFLLLLLEFKKMQLISKFPIHLKFIKNPPLQMFVNEV